MTSHFLIDDSVLVPFCDERQDPWGREMFTKAKFQFCNVTHQYYRGHDYESRCPWVNTPQNVYLLIGLKNSETLLKPNELTWDKILTEDQHRTMKHDHELVLGYFVGERDTTKGTVKIHWIQSFVKRRGVMKKMLKSIKNGVVDGCNGYIPWDIENSPEYVKEIWRKYTT